MFLLRPLILLSLHLLPLTTIHARPQILHPSDHKPFLAFQNDMNLNTKRHHSKTTPNPCNTPGVFCEPQSRNKNHTNPVVVRITRLIFNSQHLTGTLSPAIGRLSALKELSLADNHIVDQIPHQITNCKKLETLNLKNNEFSGNVPSELSKLKRLRLLDLSSNRFSGNLSFLTNFPNLETLSLAGNYFTGKVPQSLRSFSNLQHFDFSDNLLLEGPVPEMNVPKRYLLAEGPLGSKTNDSKPKRSVASSNQAPSPAKTNLRSSSQKRRRRIRGYVLGFFAGAVAGTISGFVFSVLFKLVMSAIRGGGKNPGPAIFASNIKKTDLEFLEKEDGLASLEVIGRGGCGEVYKAQMPDNGKILAIKKIIQPPKDAADLTEEDTKMLNKKMRQIRSEIQTVGKIRHRNLLPLLAHVSRPNCHYLVYEFMKNGSLQDILMEVAHGNRDLDWPARHKIALGVATALEYLHMNQNPRIIHRDLKPANILLDDDMEARIADFGLAKPMPDANTHMSTSNVAGTVGYIAPEYHQTLKFTDKCDIYSFGVLLAVLVIGKLPSDEFFQNTCEISLVKWLRNVMTSENPSQAIDPKLMGKGYDEQILLVLKIACFCTMDDANQRPNSKEVRLMLFQIKH